MKTPSQNQNADPANRQLAKACLINADRHLRHGRFREAATEANKALKLLPALQNNAAMVPVFRLLCRKVAKSLEAQADDLVSWLDDGNLPDVWHKRAEELLSRCESARGLSDSLLTIAEANSLLQELAVEDGKYHRVGLLSGIGRPGARLYSPVKALAFGPGGLLAGCTESGMLLVWEIARESPSWTAVNGITQAWGVSVSFSPDGELIASTSPFLTLWNAKTGKRVKWLDDPAMYEIVAFSQDGLLLTARGGVSASKENWRPPCLWHTQNRHIVFQLHEVSPVRCAAFGPDEGVAQQLALGTYDGHIQIWNLSWTLEGDYPNCKCRFTGAEISRTVKVSKGWVASVAFSVDGCWLAAACGVAGVHVLSVATGELLRSIVIHNGLDFRDAKSELAGCNSVAFSPIDPQHLAVACSDESVRIMDVQSGEQIALVKEGLHDGAPTPAFSEGTLDRRQVVAFHTDGTVAFAGENGKIYLWRRGLPTR